MDEKKVREAIKYNKDFIEHLKDQIECLQKKDGNRILIATYQEQIKKCETIAEALEKQLPKEIKVIDEERSEEFGDVDFYCPNCNSHYLCDIADMPNYCSDCGIRFNT